MAIRLPHHLLGQYIRLCSMVNYRINTTNVHYHPLFKIFLKYLFIWATLWGVPGRLGQSCGHAGLLQGWQPTVVECLVYDEKSALTHLLAVMA